MNSPSSKAHILLYIVMKILNCLFICKKMNNYLEYCFWKLTNIFCPRPHVHIDIMSVPKTIWGVTTAWAKATLLESHSNSMSNLKLAPPVSSLWWLLQTSDSAMANGACKGGTSDPRTAVICKFDGSIGTRRCNWNYFHCIVQFLLRFYLHLPKVVRIRTANRRRRDLEIVRLCNTRDTSRLSLQYL